MMRYFITLILLHFYLAGYAQIIINGKIKNYDGKSKVYYTPTIEGVVFTSKKIMPTSNGRFKIKYQNSGYGTTIVSFKRLSFPFFHDSKAEINLVIDQNNIKFPKNRDRERSDHIRDSVKQAATISIDGKFAEINHFYNKTVRSSTRVFRVDGCDFSILIRKAKTPDRALNIIDSLIQIELNQINRLNITYDAERVKPSKGISEIKQFLKNQVYTFYGNVFLNGMMLKRHEQGRALIRDPNTSLAIYNTQWEKLTESFFINASENIKPAANTPEYNELVLNMAYTLSDYKKYDFVPPTTTNDELIVDQLLRPKLGILDSLSLLDDKAIFAYKLHNLSRFLFTQTFYSPVLLNTINELKLKYPDSEHIEKFNPKIEELKDYLKTSSEDYEKAEIIETNYLRLTDLLGIFKGQNILIDVWATWCGPCVEDFNYKSILKPFIDQRKISILYISIDKLKWKKKWKENIKFNRLEGYHVLANSMLIKDMWNHLGGKQGVIPRYALIDKNGDVFLNEAARPGQGEELIRQIERLILTK